MVRAIHACACHVRRHVRVCVCRCCPPSLPPCLPPFVPSCVGLAACRPSIHACAGVRESVSRSVQLPTHPLGQGSEPALSHTHTHIHTYIYIYTYISMHRYVPTYSLTHWHTDSVTTIFACLSVCLVCCVVVCLSLSAAHGRAKGPERHTARTNDTSTTREKDRNQRARRACSHSFFHECGCQMTRLAYLCVCVRVPFVSLLLLVGSRT